MDTCRTCRWFRENADDRTIGVGSCRVDLPPMIERMMGLSSSALGKKDVERACGMWRTKCGT